MRAARTAAALVASALALVAAPRPPSTIGDAASDGGAIAPAAADPPPPRRAARRCVSYRQQLAARGGAVELRLASRCAEPLRCTISWRLVCDGEATPDEASWELAPSETWVVEASAARCSGDWEVAQVRWSCDRVE